MSTSNIPIYYDGHLVGSITLAEFMNQRRFGEHSVMTLMSLPKKDLIGIFLAIDPVSAQHSPKCSGMTKSRLIWNILGRWWRLRGADWERVAIKEIGHVYLSV